MEKRFKIPLVVSVILIVLVIFLQFGLPLIFGGGSIKGDMIPLIPGEGLIDLIVSISIPFIFMFISLLIGPLMNLFFIFLHKIIRLNKYEYFKISYEKEMPGRTILLRAIFPGLLAVNIAIYLSLYGTFNDLFHPSAGNIEELPIVIEWISIIIGAPIASIIVIPLWILDSSGLMCAKKIDEYNRPVAPDIESVGRFYKKLLKGFVGISTVVSYSLILFQYFTTTSDFSSIYIVFIDPIVIIFTFAPISLFIEMRAPDYNKRMDSYYEKLDIDTTPRTIKIE
ncbi:MAG: hypothetical protein GF311_23620 [Candidatus Lokiarchaeota archaeon]|nr:hypothetical protein [Candidatus Lokiarchaeota archaeon]